jgi:dCTP deaminase
MPGVDCPYQSTAVDLLLGDEISYFNDDLPLNIDLRRGGFAKLFGPNSNRTRITDEQPFVLRPRRLVLARTHEHVALPIGSAGECLAARVEGKSSYARCGLLVHFTAPTIHAGFGGTITLELYNLGPFSITLYPRAPICQLIVESCSTKMSTNDSTGLGTQARPAALRGES